MRDRSRSSPLLARGPRSGLRICATCRTVVATIKCFLSRSFLAAQLRARIAPRPDIARGAFFVSG